MPTWRTATVRASDLYLRSAEVPAWFLTSDLVMTATAWGGAYVLRFVTGWSPLTKAPADLGLYWANMPIVLLLAAAAFHLTG